MNASLNFVAQVMRQRFGFAKPQDAFIAAALEECCKSHDCSCEQLLARLQHDERLQLDLAGLLTINETHFLRFAPHFDSLTAYLLEQESREPDREKIVWSAGCSSGEEPYSVAIALAESTQTALQRRVSIWATDLSRKAIEKAQRAVYTAWSFRSTPAWLLSRYFEVNGKDCTLTARVRASVRFFVMPLEDHLNQLAPRSLDAILFRNVAIYLTDEAIARLYQGFARVLQPDGMLLIAATDPQPPSALFFRDPSQQSGVYYARANFNDRLQPVAQPRLAPPPKRAKVTANKRVNISPVGQPAPRRSTLAAAPTLTPSLGLLSEAAVAIADQGELDRAIDLADRLIAAEATAASFVLRAQLHMANDDPNAAVADFRSAIFLDGGDPLTRYWYATALSAAGNQAQAAKQLDTLAQLLAATDEASLLSDGVTTGKQLLDSCQLWLELNV